MKSTKKNYKTTSKIPFTIEYENVPNSEFQILNPHGLYLLITLRTEKLCLCIYIILDKHDRNILSVPLHCWAFIPMRTQDKYKQNVQRAHCVHICLSCRSTNIACRMSTSLYLYDGIMETSNLWLRYRINLYTFVECAGHTTFIQFSSFLLLHFKVVLHATNCMQ